MKNIRRSLNKDKIGAPSSLTSFPQGLSNSPYPSYASSHPGPAQPPAPPKRVIRAIESFRAQSPSHLSFEKGDFFHVISDEGGEDWFDASNPITGARGLVPVTHFQILGKTVKETVVQNGQQFGKRNVGSIHGPPNGFSQQQVSNTPTPPQSQPKSQPLYGIVQYDFVAERTDELDAKRGEPIIVIAQSNHEWFVAKPIGRLGGPGLIPVAFVEIQDVTTGKPVANVQELIRSAVVPKVEEWKKMTADYKSSSIPLGRFDFQPAATPEEQSTQRYSQDLYGGTADSNSYNGDQQDYDYDDQPVDYNLERQKYGLITQASVESFHQEEGSFWFHLRAIFSSGSTLILYRLYEDFLTFHRGLMAAFPVEAGEEPIPSGPQAGEIIRTIPLMPAPTGYEDELICSQRLVDLTGYLESFCRMDEEIRGSDQTFAFFVLRAGDVDVDPKNNKPMQYEATQEDKQVNEDFDQVPELPKLSGLSLNGGMFDEPATAEPSPQIPVPSPVIPAAESFAPNPPVSTTNALPATGGTAPPFVKIKVFQRNTDDLIAIRVPPTITYAALLEKVRDRLGPDMTHLRFTEEAGGSGWTQNPGAPVFVAGGVRLLSLTSDGDVEKWIENAFRLVLYAD